MRKTNQIHSKEFCSLPPPPKSCICISSNLSINGFQSLRLWKGSQKFVAITFLPSCFDYHSLVSSKTRKYKAFNFALIWDYFGCSGSLEIPYKFNDKIFYFCKTKNCWDFDRDSIDILKIFSFQDLLLRILRHSWDVFPFTCVLHSSLDMAFFPVWTYLT